MAKKLLAHGRSLIIAGILFFVPVGSGIAQSTYGVTPPNLNAHLDRLVSSYSHWIAGYDSHSLILKNGLKFPLSDHRTDKSFEELIEQPDIEDMFYVPYPAGAKPQQPPKNFDPGRVRFEPLFVAMYGDCKKNEVFPKLRTIDWLSAHGGGRVAVSTVNGVDKALEALSLQLDRLPTDFVKYLVPTAGTYNCRTVAGSRDKIDALVWGGDRFES